MIASPPRKLHLAALRNDTTEVANLLDAGVSVNETDPHGRTPVMLAARFGAEDALRLLMERGADLHQRTALGSTALSNAVDHRKSATAALLLAAGVNPDEAYPRESETTPLMKAAFAGDFALVATLINYGADPNHASPDGYTALHKAVAGKDGATVQLLLEAGARIDAEDLDGDTPLLWAVATDAVEIAELLLNRGANFRHRNRKGVRALDMARSAEILPLIDRLQALDTRA